MNQDIFNMSQEKFDSIFKDRPLPNCSKCGNKDNVIHCVYGDPLPGMYSFAEAGKVVLMGCDLPADKDKRAKAKCKQCNTFLYKLD